MNNKIMKQNCSWNHNKKVEVNKNTFIIIIII